MASRRAPNERKPRKTRELTPLLKQYAAELFADAVPDPVRAYRRACEKVGRPIPKSSSRAYGALEDPRFRAFAQKLRAPREIMQDVHMAATTLTVHRTEQEIARLSYFDIADLYDSANCLKRVADIPEDARRAIVAVEVDEIFEFSESEELVARLDKVEDLVPLLLAGLPKAVITPEIAGIVDSLRRWASPKKNERKRHLIGYTRKVKLADKKGALELAGRRDGIFKDKVEHSGSVTLEQILAESHKAPA